MCLAALGLTCFWAYRLVSDHTLDEQRTFVPVTTVWGMHACLLFGAAGLSGVAAQVARWLGRRHLLTGLGLGVLGYVAVGLAPDTNRIYYDEHIYMQIGQTIAHTDRAEYASHADAEFGQFELHDGFMNKQPNGQPYLFSWPFRLFGASEPVAQTTVRVMVGLTAALLYFALVLSAWTLPAGAPLAVSLCFVFTPLVLWWGRTAAVEPTAAATAVAVFFAVSLHIRFRDPTTGEGSPLTGALLAATAAFAAYFRPESLLVYPMAGTLLWAADRRFLEDRVTWAALALSLAMVTPTVLQLWSVHNENWGATDGQRFNAAFFGKNLSVNAGYFVQGQWYPLGGTVLALAGLGWTALCQRRLVLGLALWFLLSWGIFVLFYAGGYWYGASSRYAVVSAVPVALFAGIGASALVALLRRQPVLLGLLGAALVMNWVATMHYVPTLARESNQARADIDFAHKMAPTLPTGSLVVSNDPCLWNMLGRNAAQLGTVEYQLHNNMNQLVNEYPGGIYLHWDYWVNCEHRFADVWRQLVLDTHATVVARQTAEATQLALFRLDTAYARKTMGGPDKIQGPPVDLEQVLATEGPASLPPPAAPETKAAAVPSSRPAPPSPP
ncbi:MAG: hypothetical protein ABSE59_09445 [Opitutaceae bacterium]